MIFGRTKKQKNHSYMLIGGTIAALVFFPGAYIWISDKVSGLGKGGA